jgi:hypothetical protein
MNQFKTFKRTWWTENPKYPNGLEPGAGPKTYLDSFETEEEARAFCKEWNSENDPGRLSLKAEYEAN